MGDQLQQVVSRPDQGAVVAHPSTLADIEHIRNYRSPGVRQPRSPVFTITPARMYQKRSMPVKNSLL
jgi:hypothetical protein